ncbi:DUF2628 domain-containing protein [Parvibaculum sp.]|uniref:DUF2628 domain-containing protein n=1 Tax=Parvibaculum sp. TaxID=2024848 RepID=UPI0032110182
MRLYTVHEMSGATANGDGLEFVHEGFSWTALLLGPLWLAYYRSWLAVAIYLVAALALLVVTWLAGLGPESGSVCFLAFQFLYAGEANEIRRWSLSRRGAREIAVASGRNLIEAERDFFRRWSGPSIVSTSTPVRTADHVATLPPLMPGAVWPRRPAGDDHGVLGLFPKAGG